MTDTERHYRHYHIGANVPGYLPESDVYRVETLEDAITAVREDAERHYDYEMENEDSTATLTFADDHLDAYVSNRSEHDLGVVYWAHECNETGCDDDDV